MSFNLNFDSDEYVSFLRVLIAESEFLQNGGGRVARESLIADHVINKLKPYIDENKIRCNKIEYVEGRANLILEYGDPSLEKIVSFAGSHFDVVPANPEQWERNPFELIVEGDKLYGRGTTDCLGHVALITIILKELAEKNIQLNYKFVVVFIADEEDGRDKSIGVLHLDKDGLLDNIKAGPVYWTDGSDCAPVVASGTGMAWTLKVTGKKAHSGFPHNGINPIPIAYSAMELIIKKFNELCPRIEKDDLYNFKCHSNMKPTIWNVPSGSSANQYAEWAEITGDVRMTPFFNADEIKRELSEFANSINLENLPKLHEGFGTSCGEGENKVDAKLEFNWVFGPYCGIVCDINSVGYDMIKTATIKHHGSCKGCSELGSVPLVKEMQDTGIDIQIIGYGHTDAYHANNEYCTLSGMNKGFNILTSLLEIANSK